MPACVSNKKNSHKQGKYPTISYEYEKYVFPAVFTAENGLKILVGILVKREVAHAINLQKCSYFELINR